MEENYKTSHDLIEIDNALKKISAADKPGIIDLLPDLIKAIAKKTGIKKEQPTLNDLFHPNMAESHRRFVSVSLLRLISIEKFTFTVDQNLSIKAYSLFDDIFENDIYQSLKINKTQQTFEKERALRDVFPKIEKSLDNTIKSIRLDNFYSEFMKSFGSKLAKILIIPFLPNSLISTSTIKNINSSINGYLGNKRSQKITTLEKATDAQCKLEEYRLEAYAFGTFYSKRFLVKFADRLSNLLKNDLENYSGSKPADLEIHPVGKKYPFYEKDRNIHIGFTIVNNGPGSAFDVEVEAHCPIENMLIKDRLHQLGRLDPSSIVFKLPAKVISSDDDFSFVSLNMKWRNFDKTKSNINYEFDLIGQRADIDWEAMELEDPYSLEPVEIEAELVGREKIIRDLMRQSRARSVGSSYIFGQKRVGKTSIAKTLKNRLEEEGYLVIYLEGGDYVSPDPKETVNKLGKKFCEKIQASNSRFEHVQIPEFNDGALSPLVDFLDSISVLAPENKTIFILDEFDELPIQLFKRGPFGDSFFLTMRSISGRPPYGFALVGGEKMEFIMSAQGDALNKFRSMRVDYFDRENYWSDFQELVRRPVASWFDVSDNAINALYYQTAGNPFYTKYICNNLFNMMIENRDCHITTEEVYDAVRVSQIEIASNSFQHFWEDGIFEVSGDRVEEISIKRRKIILALADQFRSEGDATKDSIIKHEILNQYNPDDVTNEITQFIRRQVLIKTGNHYKCKVNFFKEWLTNTGVREIMTTFSDFDSIMKRKKEQEKAHVKSEEIVDLVNNWGFYKGQSINEDKVRLWLNQFGENINQRLMFSLLQHVNFYSSGRIREKLKEAHGIVSRGLTLRVDSRKRKRSDILVSYLDEPGKSGGGIYAKLYSDENGIYVDNVVERNRISEKIKNGGELKALVFIDDFIGTGGSAKENFIRLNKECGKSIIDSGLKIYFVAICGFQNRVPEIEQLLEDLGLPISVHICDPLDETVKCFSDDSCIFIEPTERKSAETIAYEHGAKIVRKNYLGFGDCQTAIVFEYNCPNNNLPILWAESEDPSWRPLFKR